MAVGQTALGSGELTLWPLTVYVAAPSLAPQVPGDLLPTTEQGLPCSLGTGREVGVL